MIHGEIAKLEIKLFTLFSRKDSADLFIQNITTSMGFVNCCSVSIFEIIDALLKEPFCPAMTDIMDISTDMQQLSHTNTYYELSSVTRHTAYFRILLLQKTLVSGYSTASHQCGCHLRNQATCI